MHSAPANPPANPKELSQLRDGAFMLKRHPQAAAQVQAMPWAADGFSLQGAQMVNSLNQILNHAPQAAPLLDSPLVRELNSLNLQAIRSMAQLVTASPQSFHRVINHPILRNQPAAAEYSAVIAAVWPTEEHFPRLTDRLLNLATTNTQTSRVVLPHTGPVNIILLRQETDGDPETIHRIEKALRYAEDFMQTPLPTDQIVVLVADVLPPGIVGYNYSTHITVPTDSDRTSPEPQWNDYVQKSFTHEAAHHYWQDNATWINEGMAELIAEIGEHRRTGAAVTAAIHPDPKHTAIKDVPKYGAATAPDYALGKRLFLDLRDAAGPETFQQRMIRIYRTTQERIPQNGYIRSGVHLKEIEEAFDSAPCRRVIDRWYHGSNDYRTDLYDFSDPDPRLNYVYGKLTQLHVTLDGSTPAPPQIPANRIRSIPELYLQLEYPEPRHARTLNLEARFFHHDGHCFLTRRVQYQAQPGSNGGYLRIPMADTPSQGWKPGHYAAFIYQDNTKLAHFAWDITE